MRADKNSFRRRWRVQQDEHGFQHTSLTHSPSWPSPCSHWSATGPRNQQTTFRAKAHQDAQWKLARLDACAAPVRPMACAGQTGDTGQTGGQSWSGRWTKTCPIKRNRRNPAKNSSNPRTPKTPKSSPLTHGFGRGIKG
jgi:hypothetical protein